MIITNADKGKGQMALEYIVKLLIVTVVIMVVIGMIQKFRGDAIEDWKIISQGNEDEQDLRAVVVEGTFAAEDMAHFVETCWAETRGADDDRVCFVLKGTYQGSADYTTAVNEIKLEIENTQITDSLDVPTNTKFDKELFSVSYELSGSRIVLE